MSLAETRYTARFEFADLLERGRDNVVTCPVYFEGALVAPASGTVEVFDNGGNSVATPAVAIIANVSTATVTAASLTAEGFAQGWRIEWALTIGGVVFNFRNEAALVRNQLYPVITDVDLLRHHPDLTALRPSDRPSMQLEIEEAWAMIQTMLYEAGNRPNLVVNPGAFRTAHKWLALSIVFDGMADGPQGTDDRFAERAKDYSQRFERAWDKVAWRFDSDEDGTPDDPNVRHGTRGTVYLTDILPRRPWRV